MKTQLCDCPREGCEGFVQVSLEYEPPDPHYGMDADGNRGIYVAGYWSAEADDTCSLGHVLIGAELLQLQTEAEEAVEDCDDDDYDGPDRDDIDE